jgi:hypothetical protein
MDPPVHDAGAAYVFYGAASLPPDLDPSGLDGISWFDGDSWFGFSVAGAGDVNGDGFADVVVGGPSADYYGAEAGIAYVYFGGGWLDYGGGAIGMDPGERLGWSVAGAGDVNGDGFADIIVGAPGYDAGEGPSEGAAFVYFGGVEGINGADPVHAGGRLEADQAGAQLGTSVASIGDSNGDGYADVVAGAPFFNAGQTHEGAVFAFLGNRAGRPVLARQQTADGGAVEPWGRSQQGDGFRVSLRATHPAGAGLVRAEVEACPHDVPFGDTQCTSGLTPDWVAVNAAAPDVALTMLLHGLDEGTLYRWRARVLHAEATSTQPGVSLPPVPAHGPWRRVQAQAVEADVRVVPEPGSLISLVSGIALLAVLARRRSGQ